jgi:hypothetical protein
MLRVIGIACLCAMSAMFGFALCKASKEIDETLESIWGK